MAHGPLVKNIDITDSLYLFNMYHGNNFEIEEFSIIYSEKCIFSLGLYTLFVLTTSGDMKILRDFNKETFVAGGGKKDILSFDE